MATRIFVNWYRPLYTVLLWYDCILTFREEVQCIWGRRFTGATAVYLATRYIAAIERVVLVLMGVLWTINDEVRPPCLPNLCVLTTRAPFLALPDVQRALASRQCTDLPLLCILLR